MTRRRRRPDAPPLAPDDVVCGRTTSFTLQLGSPLRAANCLICCQAIGGASAFIFTMFRFRVIAEQCGAFAAASWLAHQSHPTLPDEQMVTMALFRHQTCLEGKE